MIETLGGFDPTALGRFDAVIDVRSPAEFAEDHIPGAINLPVLEDGERAKVGTIYVQESRLKARRVGAAEDVVLARPSAVRCRARTPGSP